MKKLNAIVLSCLICMSFLHSYSQSIPVNLPNVVPPPAEAATLGKYGDIPVDLHRGTTKISVPVYEIKTSRLSLPITLNYAPTGIKVDERASWVGLGWSLDAGGLITRTIKGLDDFVTTKGYFYHAVPPDADTITQQYSWQYLEDVTNGLVDAEPDPFFYNFLNFTGKYVFGENKLPMIINYQDPLKIQFDASAKSFTILDGEGNQYIFADKDTTQSYYTMLSNSPFPNHDQIYISSWLLTKIISFDKSDTLQFSYYKDNEQVETYFNYSEAVGQKYTCPGPTLNGYSHDGAGEISSQSFIRNNPRRLQEITFRNGKVTFYSSANRSDAAIAKLDSVKVFRLDPASQTFQLLKKTRLYYSYFNTTGSGQAAYRLRLDSVRTFGSGDLDGGRHAFSYNSTQLPGIGNNAKDLFGYYNGQTNNTTLVPRDTVLYGGLLFFVGGANRTVHPDYLKAGVLEKVTYPTGGFTNFEYEPNSYFEYGTKSISKSANATGIIHQTDTLIFTATASTQAIMQAFMSRYNYPGVQTQPFVSLVNLTTSQTIYLNGIGTPTANFELYQLVSLVQGNTYRLIAKAFDDDHVFSGINVTWKEPDSSILSKYGGGLRIKQVKSFAWDGKFATSELYKYGASECGYGYLPGPSFLLNTFSREQSFYIGCLDPITSACTSGTLTRKVFGGSSIYDVFNLSSSPVSYSEVAKFIVDSLGNSLGKTVYKYSVYSNSLYPASQSFYEGLSIVNNGWIGGQLISQSDYSLKGVTFYPVKKIINSYDSIPLQVGRGLRANYIASNSGCFTQGPTGYPGYYVFDYPIYSGSSLPKTEIVYDYDQKDTTKFATVFKSFAYYNLTHIQPTRVKTSTSTGDTLVTINRFPIDKDSIAGITNAQRDALDALVSGHNITELVQTQSIRNSDPIVLTRNDFRIWPGAIILPDSVRVQNSNYSIERRMQYHKYDSKGNVVQVALANNINQTYIWDHNATLPIAEIKNADSTSVAYTSFEADSKGNWSYSGVPFRDNTAPMGRKVYKLSTGSLSKTGLSASATYLVSYWSKNGSQTVNSSTAVAGNSVGSWQLWIHKVVNPASGTITISGIGIIDEIRLCPEFGQMTTYTHEPLVGITSECDVSGKITYYEFDELQRLMLIRDHNKKILKKICYNFSGQADNCPIYYNVEKSGSFTRSCTSPAVGSQVTYVVPEGSYSSTINQTIANSLAQADVDQNGQAYAEINGNCILAFSGINLTSVTWSITVTQVDGTFSGNYSLNPTVTANFLANIPTGIYNITMTPSSTVNSVQLVLNGSTYNGTSFNLNNISIGTTGTFTLQGPPCTYSMQSGFTKVAGDITNNGTGVSFYLSFSRNSQMVQNTTYIPAIISTNCRPPQWVSHTFQWTQSFRNWTLYIFDNGQFALSFTGGLPVPTNATITTPSFNYNF